MQWHRGTHQRSVTCQCQMPVWYNTDLCESKLLHFHLTPSFCSLSDNSSCNCRGMKFHKSITGDIFDLVVLLYFTLFSSCSRLSGHHPGTVDPLCFVFSGWGRTVCLVLHRWIGSQRAATLWEQLHQRAGVCLCVGGREGRLEGCNGGVCLSESLSDSDVHTHTHTIGLTQTHTYPHSSPTHTLFL